MPRVSLASSVLAPRPPAHLAATRTKISQVTSSRRRRCLTVQGGEHGAWSPAGVPFLLGPARLASLAHTPPDRYPQCTVQSADTAAAFKPCEAVSPRCVLAVSPAFVCVCVCSTPPDRFCAARRARIVASEQEAAHSGALQTSAALCRSVAGFAP